MTSSLLLLGQIAREFPREGPRPRLSLISPVFNEVDNLRPLFECVAAALDEIGTWELILVDDGSLDGSADLIRELAREDRRVVGAFFARNTGQTAALGTGFALARGELIATIDADLQNDPADLPGMLAVLGEYDAVVGYRVKRNDNWLRRVSSKIANAVRNKLSGDSIRDTGCALKLFRAEALRMIPLYEGLHRFFPTLLRYHGFAVLEHPVSHRPRVAGQSKYGVMNRAWRAFKDLLAVRWMHGRLIRVPLAEVSGRADS